MVVGIVSAVVAGWVISPLVGAGTINQGTVRWVNESKGFGLITLDGSSNDLFARSWVFPAILSSKAVEQKHRLSFHVMTSPDGDHAVNIKMLL